MSERTFRRVLLGVVLGALILRVAYTLLFLDGLALPNNFDHVNRLPFRPIDEMYYSSGARAFGVAHVFRFHFFGPMREQAYLPPLTSLILAPIARFTEELLPMRIAGAIGGSAVVVVVALVGRAVNGPKAGIAAAVLAAIYPNLWVSDGLLLAETWSALTTALVLLATYRFLMHRSAGRAVLIGVACGLATLALSELVLLIPLLGGYLLLSSRSSPRPQRLAQVGVLVGAAILVVTPWVVYNLTRFERPVLLTNGIGDVMIGANCPTTYYGDDIGFTDSLCPLLPKVDPDEDPSVVSDEHREVATRYIRRHLDRVPLVVAAREGRVWSLYAPGRMAKVQQSDGRPTWVSYLGLAMYWCLVPLSVLGAIVVHRRRRALFPLLTPILVVAINAALFYGYVRYRVPAEISFVILAGVAIGAFFDRRSNRVSRVPAA